MKGLITFVLGLAVMGIYAACLIVPTVMARDGWRPAIRHMRGSVSRTHVLAVVVALALLLLVPVRPNLEPGSYDQAGYLWKIARATPLLGASSLFYWPLVPAGALFLTETIRRLGAAHPLPYMRTGVVAIGLSKSDAYQKYFDAPILLLLLASAPAYGICEHRVFRLVLAGLCAFGLVYTGLSHFHINAK